MLDDAQIQVVGYADVKRAFMAAENVDAAAGQHKMLANSWFSAPRGKTVAEPPVRASVVEKLRAPWVK